MRRAWRPGLIAVVALVAAYSLVAALIHLPPFSSGGPETAAVMTSGGTVSGLHGQVTLQVPPNAAAPGTKVAFSQGPGDTAKDPVAGNLNAVQVMPPVNVDVTSRRLARDSVRITLHVPDGRPAAVYRVAFISVYEPQLGEWVPLVDSEPFHLVFASWICNAWMALASCPARQGQQRSLRSIRQVLSQCHLA